MFVYFPFVGQQEALAAIPPGGPIVETQDDRGAKMPRTAKHDVARVLGILTKVDDPSVGNFMGKHIRLVDTLRYLF